MRCIKQIYKKLISKFLVEYGFVLCMFMCITLLYPVLNCRQQQFMQKNALIS